LGLLWEGMEVASSHPTKALLPPIPSQRKKSAFGKALAR
jgi:hypothetical protein